MKRDIARALRDALTDAIEKADAAGSDEVNLAETVFALDDAARTELDAAIRRAESK